MDLTVPAAVATELAAAWFQGAVTLGLFLVFLLLEQRYQKPWFRGWAIAWGVYTLRLAAIIVFLQTEAFVWLYWHQVLTGMTALALLWAALVFSRGIEWRWRYTLLILFPIVWSRLAIYEMDNFLLAALPAVLFLSGATAATAWAFHQYGREAGSRAAKLLAFGLALWALHHLDYPFLRARGAWNPWGYYLDLGFQLWVGIGILLLVQEDLREGLRALSILSAELQAPETPEALESALMERAVTLRGVIGSAFWTEENGFVVAAGTASEWTASPPPAVIDQLVREVHDTGMPQVQTTGSAGIPPFVAGLPILRGREVSGVFILLARVRDPFTALDQSFLRALGQQVGAALRNAALMRQSTRRGEELELLQAEMVRRHEEERNRLARELHDETAQVLAAVNLRLGLVGEDSEPAQREAIDHVRGLVGDGIRGIRRLTGNLRPSALDHLGLASAGRAVVRDYASTHGLDVTWTGPVGPLPTLSAEAELAFYRAVQEGLANVARHAPQATAAVRLSVSENHLALEVRDNGPGLPEAVAEDDLRRGSGLSGLRERMRALGGTVTIGPAPDGGVLLRVRMPISPAAPNDLKES